jgi:drug/metabolite transporter (DMT)-like permease
MSVETPAPNAPTPVLTSSSPEATPPTPRTPGLTWLAMSVTVVLWASAFVVVRSVGHDFSAAPLTFGRIAVGSLALSVMVLVLPRRDGPRWGMPRGRVLAAVAVWGLAWFGTYNLAFNAAERHLDAGTTAILVNIAPMLVALLAGVVLGEGFPRRLVVGVAVAFAGVVLIATASSSAHLDRVGILLGLAAAVLYAGSATLQKSVLPRVNALTMTWLGCLAGTIAFLPFAPTLVRELQTAPTSSVLGIVYLGIFPTAIAFSTWGYVLARVTAGRTAASTYAVPAIVVLMSWALLAEVPPTVALIGGVLALAGVAVATLRRR